MSKWYCSRCGFMYNEETGNPKYAIPAHTPFSSFDPTWACPLCRTPRDMFIQVG